MTSRVGPSRLRSTLVVLAAVVPIVVVLAVSLTATILQSLGLMPVVGPPELTLQAWTADGRELLRASGISLYIATVSTALSLVIGFVLAAFVMTSPRAGRVVAALSAATIPVPHLIAAGATGLLLSDSGFLQRVLGMPEVFPALVGTTWWSAAIFEYVWKESAFVALVVLGSISSAVPGLCDTAATLGATARQRVMRVVLPLAVPSLAISGVIIFVYTLGSYEAVWLLGPTAPEPLVVRAVRLFGSVDLAARPEAMVAVLVSVGISAAAILVGVRVLRGVRSLR